MRNCDVRGVLDYDLDFFALCDGSVSRAYEHCNLLLPIPEILLIGRGTNQVEGKVLRGFLRCGTHLSS